MLEALGHDGDVQALFGDGAHGEHHQDGQQDGNDFLHVGVPPFLNWVRSILTGPRPDGDESVFADAGGRADAGLIQQHRADDH